MIERKIHILVGLPGSGKSNYAASLNKNQYAVLDVDKAVENRHNWLKVSPSIREAVNYAISDLTDRTHSFIGCCDNIVLDGLFLTEADIANAAKPVADMFSGLVHCTLYVHQWNEDRATCEKNDEDRRTKSSIGSIRTAEYHPIDVELIRKGLEHYPQISVCQKIIPHTVELKPEWQRKYGNVIDVDGILRSKKYMTSGKSGNCWNDQMTYTEGEKVESFYELYDFLAEAFPDLKLKDWRKIEPKVVDQDSWQEPEYYGGYSNYVQWICDIKKLYSLLENQHKP